MPSRMLNARFQVVEFTGRQEELCALRRWRDGEPRLAARLLHGPGGQGKTRLAARLAQESLARDWKVVSATLGQGAVLPPPGSQDLRVEGARGLLVVVDYADRWPLSALTWLSSNALLHHPTLRTRVLLLARGADGWPSVRAALAQVQADTSAHLLEPLGEGEGGVDVRARMFRAARDSFAAHVGVRAAGLEPPGPLAHPDFGLTLALHMAALVAVDAAATGIRAPRDMAGLTVYLLDREHLHWRIRYEDAGRERAGAGSGFATPPETMNRTVFLAALSGPLPPGAGGGLVRSVVGCPSVERLLDDHAVCYPPAESGAVLEPLYPDRLAEDFLALTLPGHSADYPAQAWARPALDVFAAADGPAPPASLARAMTFLVSAAERWPHVGPRHLFPLLHDRPWLALTAGSTVLSALARLDGVATAVLENVAGCFPADRHVDLDLGMAAVTRELADRQLPEAGQPTERADRLLTLGYRLWQAGLLSEALPVARDAIAAWQAVDPRAPGRSRFLGTAWTNLGAVLSDLGRGPEAVAATARAVEVLDASGGDAEAAELGKAWSNLGNQLHQVRRFDEAVTVTRRAVAVRRRLASSDRQQLPGLAFSLNNLGLQLADTGDHAAALASVGEALGIYYRLAADRPDTYAPDLARALHNQGLYLARSGRLEEAVAATHQAVALRRSLAEVNPAAFRSALARSLRNLGQFCHAAGATTEATAALEEAVALLTALAAADPGRFEAELSAVQRVLGGLRTSASGAANDAGSSPGGPEVVRLDPRTASLVAARLTVRRGHDLIRAGAADPAVRTLTEAVRMLRSMSQMAELAGALSLLASAHLLSDRGAAAALVAARESVLLHSRLAAHDPDAFGAALETARAIRATAARAASGPPHRAG
ncbi:tetratricopeptide repeat protein [Streptomyces sp. NPDC048506]|uniref:tetratricopeptide repeat protein n=1 Tax=Streptomyces sp. NPDC048506 TaxID=3155028 RepID=UPI003421E897